MESGYWKTFVEVVRCGSFSRAAELLFITQSAASRRVKFMEEQYGTPLLDRSGPILKPTRAGLIVHEKALLLLALEDELTQELRKEGGSISLSFACSRPFGISHLPDIMKKFLSRYEDKVDIKLSFETPEVALQGLRDGLHSIVVIEHWEKLVFAPHHVVRLGLDPEVLVSSPRLGLPAALTVDDLLVHRLYQRAENCCSARLLAHNMALLGRKAEEFRHVLLYDDLHVIISSVCAGEGIAFLPKSLVEGMIQTGALCEHAVEGFSLSRKRSLVYREELMEDHPFSYFITCITSACAVGRRI